MKRIKLQKGLIAIGSNKDEGKTRFSLKLANHIAKSEKVLYISYTDYKEKLISILEKMDGFVNDNLDLNTEFAYCGSEVFLEIIKYVKSKNISTVFIDDIDDFCSFSGSKDKIISDLKYLSELLDIKLFFLTNIMRQSIDEGIEQYSRNFEPAIRDFKWSRRIINDCSQIFALYRPTKYGFTIDAEGNSLLDRIEIYSLKNKENKEEIIFMDNKELNIYDFYIKHL